MIDPDNLPQRPTALQPQSKPDTLPDPLIERVWQVMASMYANAWTTPYGVDPHGDTGRIWARRLAGMTAQHLARGFAACERAERKDFPPTLPQFRAWCVGTGQAPESQTDAARTIEAQRRYVEAREQCDREHFARFNAIAAEQGFAFVPFPAKVEKQDWLDAQRKFAELTK